MTPSVPPGWYADPYDTTQYRWWDGCSWTAAVGPGPSASGKFLRSFPWRGWAPWLAAIGVGTFICFSKAESAATHNPETWYLAGFCIAGSLTLVTSLVTLRNRRWIDVFALAALIVVIASLAIFVTAAPSTSRSCHAQYDCDTSFGLGLPIVAVLLFVPTVGITLVGELLVAALRRPERAS